MAATGSSAAAAGAVGGLAAGAGFTTGAGWTKGAGWGEGTVGGSVASAAGPATNPDAATANAMTDKDFMAHLRNAFGIA